jgi:hypothetical protein
MSCRGAYTARRPTPPLTWWCCGGGGEERVEGAVGGLRVGEQAARHVKESITPWGVLGELAGVGVGPEVALADAGGEDRGEGVGPVALHADEAVPHRPGAARRARRRPLRAGNRPQRSPTRASARRGPAPGARPAAPLSAGNLVDEPLRAVLQHLQLQRLLGAEVGRRGRFGCRSPRARCAPQRRWPRRRQCRRRSPWRGRPGAVSSAPGRRVACTRVQ